MDAEADREYHRLWYLKNRERILVKRKADYTYHPIERPKYRDEPMRRWAADERTRQWNLAHPGYMRNYHIQKKALGRAVADGELARGCVDCGETDLRVLEFDHVSGVKEFMISTGIAKGLAPKEIYTEIDKCEVRCANCHRRVTYQRRFGK